MFDYQSVAQRYMAEKIALKDLLTIKQLVDQMDLREFKAQWDHLSSNYEGLEHDDRLKIMVMSIKILQAKVDLKRTITAIKESATHPDPEQAILYYLQTNLWKFLDNFHYILLVEDVSEQDKLECLDLLDETRDVIARDEKLKNSCLTRLFKLLDQVRMLENTHPSNQKEVQAKRIYKQLERRIIKLLRDLSPADVQIEEPSPLDRLPQPIQELIRTYSSFSVARISIEKAGVSSIIQSLSDHPLPELEEQRTQLQAMLTTLEEQVASDPEAREVRNLCAYALVVLLEMLKLHEGLPVLLLRILDLCGYIYSPPMPTHINKEIKGLKERVIEISQKRLRPIIEDLLWKNPKYFESLPGLRKNCPWCYQKAPQNGLNLKTAQRIVTTSFDHMLPAYQHQILEEGVAGSLLSEKVIEILGLLVNIEPSPRFLKLHAQETMEIKKAKEKEFSESTPLEELFEQQYTTYKNHLKFLQDSIDYYNGILESIKETA